MISREETLSLVEECRAGNRRAQESLFRKFYAFAMQTAMRYSRNEDDAADITSVAFTKAFRSIHSFDINKGSLHGWIQRIVINEAIDQVKAKEKFSDYETVEKTGEAGIDNNAIAKLSAQELLALIRMLPPLRQTVFNLYVIEGYNHREIAELTGMKEGTSKWHLAEAREQLKQQILNRKLE